MDAARQPCATDEGRILVALRRELLPEVRELCRLCELVAEANARTERDAAGWSAEATRWRELRRELAHA